MVAAWAAVTMALCLRSRSRVRSRRVYAEAAMAMAAPNSLASPARVRGSVEARSALGLL